MRWVIRTLIFASLTALTQLGGLAYIAALVARRRRLAVFVTVYSGVWIAAVLAAPAFGREPLPCFGEPLRMQSPFYCVTLRHFVVPDMARVAEDAAHEVAAQYPGTVTLALDGSLPFIDGFPLLPHLSHDDGQKLDFAFYYSDSMGYVGLRTRSLIGFFAFEALGPEECPRAWPTLRWDMRWLQPLWPDWRADPGRNAALVRALAADPRVGKILLEPPLTDSWGVAHPKVRFQGCRAARHDDHIHVQL